MYLCWRTPDIDIHPDLTSTPTDSLLPLAHARDDNTHGAMGHETSATCLTRLRSESDQVVSLT
jgi:hypothetical protein